MLRRMIRHSGKQTKIEELNSLIEKVEKLESSYNELVGPFARTKVEIRQNQYFFQQAKDTEEETKEAQILKDLEKRLKKLASPEKKQTCEKLNAEINETKKQLELLWIEIEGKCDRSSPSFLEKIQT